MRYIKSIIFTSLLSLFVACQMNTQSLNDIGESAFTIQSIADVYNVHWRLTAASTDTGTIDLPSFLPVILVFSDDDSLFGVSGCNFYSGSYSTNSNQVTFSRISQTEIACQAPALDMPRWLSGSWAISFTDTSVILNRNNQQLTFVSYHTLPLTDFPVTQGTWRLVVSNFNRYDEVKQVAFRLQMTPTRTLSVQWVSLTDSSYTNRVRGYFNRGQDNKAFIRWWVWVYNGFRNFPLPPADVALINELENVTSYELSENNTLFQLQTANGVYFRFQKE